MININVEDMVDSARLNANAPVGLSDREYEATLQKMYEDRLGQFDQYTKPLMDQLEKEASSNAIYDRAVVQAGKVGSKVNAATQRNDSLSMGSLLPSQQRARANRQQADVQLMQSSMLTDASIKARENRMASRSQLMGMAEQLQNTGSTSLTQAVQQKNQRDAANRAAKSGFMSQVGAIAGAGIGFLAGGGPAGMAAGASIGGGIGGIVGG